MLFNKWTLQSAHKSDLIQKLVQIARGDVELVHRAIRSTADAAGAADLEKIVSYIQDHRPHGAKPHAEAVGGATIPAVTPK